MTNRAYLKKKNQIIKMLLYLPKVFSIFNAVTRPSVKTHST